MKFILTTHSPHLLLSGDTTEERQNKQDPYGHEKPAKVTEFDNSYFQAWKRSMEICFTNFYSICGSIKIV